MHSDPLARQLASQGFEFCSETDEINQRFKNFISTDLEACDTATGNEESTMTNRHPAQISSIQAVTRIVAELMPDAKVSRPNFTNGNLKPTFPR